MRGKAANMDLAQASDRITPACAGKRYLVIALVSWNRDHPRVCGEKFFFFNAKLTIQGSPPRVRGKAATKRFYTRFLRITPACAGKRHFATGFSSSYGDHPRVCGEKTKKIP